MNILIVFKIVVLFSRSVFSVPIKWNRITNSLTVTVKNITVKNDDEGDSKFYWSVCEKFVYTDDRTAVNRTIID